MYYSGDTSYKKDLLLDIKEKFQPDICFIAFEHFKSSPSNLVISMGKYEEIQRIFEKPIIPVHQKRKWYEQNLYKYLNGVKDVSLLKI